MIRYHVTDAEQRDDYVEGLDGTRAGNLLVVRYFIKGTMWGAETDAQAAGTPVPSSK